MKTVYPCYFVNLNPGDDRYICHFVPKRGSVVLVIYKTKRESHISCWSEHQLDNPSERQKKDWFVEMAKEEIVLYLGFLPDVNSENVKK